MLLVVSGLYWNWICSQFDYTTQPQSRKSSAFSRLKAGVEP